MPKILGMEQTRRGRNLNIHPNVILGDPGADSGGDGKSKRAEK